jgi:hypothetical protein
MTESGVQKTPIYVIGYPKSGTVWMTRLVADTLQCPSYGLTPAGEKSINNLDASGFDRKSNFEVLHGHLIAQNLPCQINEQSRIIYVVRDFRDVVVSGFFHHYRINEKLVLLNYQSSRYRLDRIFWRRLVFTLEINKLIQHWSCWSGGTTELEFIKRLMRVVISGRFMDKIKGGTVGNWSDHVNGWIDFSPNIATIRYEDLLAGPKKLLQDALSRLELPFYPVQLTEAIDQNRFKKKKSFFENKNDTKNVLFLRKGIAGDWQRFLDKNMLKKIKQKHGVTMELMGYR